MTVGNQHAAIGEQEIELAESGDFGRALLKSVQPSVEVVRDITVNNSGQKLAESKFGVSLPIRTAGTKRTGLANDVGHHAVVGEQPFASATLVRKGMCVVLPRDGRMRGFADMAEDQVADNIIGKLP